VTALDLLADLRARGVLLSTYSDRLHVDAPRGVLTDSDRALLAEHKMELLAALAGHVAEGDAVYLLDVAGQTHNLEPWTIDAIVDSPDGPLAFFVGKPFTSWPVTYCRRAAGTEATRHDAQRRAS